MARPVRDKTLYLRTTSELWEWMEKLAAESKLSVARVSEALLYDSMQRGVSAIRVEVITYAQTADVRDGRRQEAGSE